jgi:hypothetical protein
LNRYAEASSGWPWLKKNADSQEYIKEKRKADGQEEETPNPGFGENPGKYAFPAGHPGKRGPG